MEQELAELFESYVILYITKTENNIVWCGNTFESYVILYITKTLHCHSCLF